MIGDGESTSFDMGGGRWLAALEAIVVWRKDMCEGDVPMDGPLTEAVLLGCLASDFPGEKLTWDAANLSIPNSDAAQGLVTRLSGGGW